MTQKTAIIYLRVSSVQQARNDLPIESQLRFAEKKARDLGAVVVRVFTDNGISGRSDKRQDFQDAITYCELHKPDYFIAWDTARFARNRIDAAQYKRDLRQIGTDVVYVSMSIDTKTDEGWFLEAMLEVMDESASRRISKDTKRSMIQNAEQGFFNGGRCPFGYQLIADGKRKRMAVLEEEAVVVRQMFSMCERGMGAKAIAMQMNSAGLLSRGKKWVKSNVIYLLRNQSYAGYTVFNRRKHHARTLEAEADWIRTKSHDAIIDEDRFMRIQHSIAGRAPTEVGGTPKSTHLFTGLLRCGVCGSAMHIESATGRSKVYYYYRCGDAKRGFTCMARRISADEIDGYLAQVILDEVLTRERVSEIMRDIEAATSEWWKERALRRDTIVGEIRSNEKKRKNLFSLLELHGKDAPNLADISVRLRDLKTNIETLEVDLVRLESERDPLIDISEEDIDQATDTLRSLVTAVADPVVVRTFFSSFVKRVVVGPTQAMIEYDPSKIMNRGISVVHNEKGWLPEHVSLRTARLAVGLPPRIARQLAGPIAA
jgi:site-specific DNA recombinase